MGQEEPFKMRSGTTEKGREPSSDRVINLQIFTTDVPMYRRSAERDELWIASGHLPRTLRI
jgi:hypothetical protein